MVKSDNYFPPSALPKAESRKRTTEIREPSLGPSCRKTLGCHRFPFRRCLGQLREKVKRVDLFEVQSVASTKGLLFPML